MKYDLEQKELIIFAIRGTLPEEAISGNFEETYKFKRQHRLVKKEVDFNTCSCTIGLWDRLHQRLALFPGSTVPSSVYLFHHPASLQTFNMLCTGMYELRRAVHPRNGIGYQPHEALVMDGYGLVEIPELMRTDSYFRIDPERFVKRVLLPGDNLHAARIEPVGKEMSSLEVCISTLSAPFSGSGCITIIGQPRGYFSNGIADGVWNCWEQFMYLLGTASQYAENYKFILFDASDIEEFDASQPDGQIIRYGSSSIEVGVLQQHLHHIFEAKTGKAYYRDTIDNRFLKQTATAYLQFWNDITGGKPLKEIRIDDFLRLTRQFSLR